MTDNYLYSQKKGFVKEKQNKLPLVNVYCLYCPQLENFRVLLFVKKSPQAHYIDKNVLKKEGKHLKISEEKTEIFIETNIFFVSNERKRCFGNKLKL